MKFSVPESGELHDRLSQEIPGSHHVVPARRPIETISAALLILLCLAGVWIVLSSPNVQWSAIPEYLFDQSILTGIRLTLIYTVLSMIIGLVLGTGLALMKQTTNSVLSGLAGLYIWLFRGTPLLVQIIIWFNIQLFIPRIALLGFSIDTNDIVTPFLAALLALGLNEAAYMAEIVRGGLLSVDKGQHEAASALGYRPSQIAFSIILPQALRVITPAIGNQTISMLKTTSLVSIVAAQDLLTRVQNIYSMNFLVIELLIVASLWYLLMTSIASSLQYLIERRLNLSQGVQSAPALLRLASKTIRRATK